MFLGSLLCLMLAAQTPPVVTYPAGAYGLTFTVPAPFAVPFAVTQTSTSLTVTWGPAPAPGPTPVPVPPAPTPPAPPAPVVTVTGHVWVTAVYDYSALSGLPQAQLDLRTSTTISAALAAPGMDANFREYDKANPAVATYLPPGCPLPALLWIVKGPSGKGQLAGGSPIPLPASEASVVAALATLRGVGVSH